MYHLNQMKGSHGVTVIFIENELSDVRLFAFHIVLGKDMNPTILPTAILAGEL